MRVATIAILETIAAANAAYSVIRKCLENGREVTDMVGQVGKFLAAEEELKEQVKKKKNSAMTAITGGEEGDWECFQQLEKITEQRKELESFCRLYAKPGTWDRWQTYQNEARVSRAAAKKKREKERQELMNTLGMTGAGLLGVLVAVGIAYFVGLSLGKW